MFLPFPTLRCLSGTHTHSAPAGFLTHTIFQVTSLGFCKESYNAFANGIAQSIIKAVANIQPARVFLGEGKVKDANINRSPTAYTFNSQAERDLYPDGNTDKGLTMLKFMSADMSRPIGMVNWYSVHGTAMNNTNKLISGDNKGYASALFEKYMNPEGTLPGKGTFVAAFAATNLGDVSPNVNGSFCMDTGLPCEMEHSTCNGRNEMCTGRGPGQDMFDSTKIIAERQVKAAKQIWNNATEELLGPIDMRHTWVDMTNLTFKAMDGTTKSTCGPAMGYAFAAGTTDGPGMFNFIQGDNTTNPFWNLVSHFLSKPTKEEVECHSPKPILLNLEGINFPYPWAAKVLPLQVVRMGRFFTLSVPSELTTMAGRRLRKAVRDEIINQKLSSNPVVVIAGLSNEYADYTTTFEEYQAQRYEGASTAYGPNELEAFISQFKRLIQDMANGVASKTLPKPPTYLNKQISLQPGVIYDSVASGTNFGDVVIQPQPEVKVGDIVQVKFRSSNPRNNLRTEDTFLAIQKLNNDGVSWIDVAVDGNWETKFEWSRPHELEGESFANIVWTVPAGTPIGTYRVQHYNTHKSVLGKLTDFTGTSNTFKVVSSN
jgi:neutral ceramidase